MCEEENKKKKCKKRTHSLVRDEKSRVMKETLQHLKELRELMESKQVA